MQSSFSPASHQITESGGNNSPQMLMAGNYFYKTLYKSINSSGKRIAKEVINRLSPVHIFVLTYTIVLWRITRTGTGLQNISAHQWSGGIRWDDLKIHRHCFNSLTHLPQFKSGRYQNSDWRFDFMASVSPVSCPVPSRPISSQKAKLSVIYYRFALLSAPTLRTRFRSVPCRLVRVLLQNLPPTYKDKIRYMGCWFISFVRKAREKANLLYI